MQYAIKVFETTKIQVLKLNGNINVFLVSSIDFKGTNVLDVGLNIFYCILHSGGLKQNLINNNKMSLLIKRKRIKFFSPKLNFS